MAEAAVVLPTYNEAGNLEALVRELEALPVDLRIFIVDDNSRDGTLEAALELARDLPNVAAVPRPHKLGLGSALREGLARALDTDARYLVTMDADWSHDPRDVPRLLEAIAASGVDLVQGSRYVAGGGIQGMTPVRRFSSRLANLVYHWAAGAPHESTTNFRVFSRRAASLVTARAKGRHFEFVPEALLLVRAAGMRVEEIPIVFRSRARGRSKAGLQQVVRGVLSVFSLSLQRRLGLGRFARGTPAGPGADS